MATMKRQVAEAGGMKRVSLGDLRRELGYERLGKWVIEEIATGLEEDGLGYFPMKYLDPAQNETPRQDQSVWVYEQDGGTRARVINAVLDPDHYDVTVALGELGESQLTPEQKLERIRMILGQG